MARKTEAHIELEKIYGERNPEGHWFDEKTIKFFKSRIHEMKTEGKDIYFISSEQPPVGSRVFSVRHMDKDGRVHTCLKEVDYKACKNWLKDL